MLRGTFVPKDALLACAAAYLSVISAAVPWARAAPSYNIIGLGLLPGTIDGGPEGINNSSQVVGECDNAPVKREAFLYSDGTISGVGTASGTYSNASAINDSGQIVGMTGIPGATQAYLWSKSAGMEYLGTLGGATSSARAINAEGQVVGRSLTATGTYHAFLYSNGTMLDLGSANNSAATFATGINNAGQVVGTSLYGADSLGNPFLYSQGIMKILNGFGGIASGDANAINNNSQVVGTATSDGIEYAVMWTSSGEIIDLGAGRRSDALAVNDNGVAVGYGTDSSSGLSYAFVYSNEAIYNLNSLIPSGSGWVLDLATAINNNGDIVGEGTFNGTDESFLLTPTPEPATLAILTLGLAGLTLTRRRSRQIACQCSVAGIYFAQREFKRFQKSEKTGASEY